MKRKRNRRFSREVYYRTEYEWKIVLCVHEYHSARQHRRKKRSEIIFHDYDYDEYRAEDDDGGCFWVYAKGIILSFVGIFAQQLFIFFHSFLFAESFLGIL